MKKEHYVVGLLALAPWLTGCNSLGGFGASEVKVQQVDSLGERIEAVHVETEIARQRVHDAVAMLEVVSSPDRRGDPVVAYADFVAAIDECEKQAEVLRGTVEPMVDDAEDFFARWGEELESYSSAQMRNLSRTRLARTHQRYKTIAKLVGPAQSLLDELNLRFRDCATFLAYDFNPASIDAIQSDVADMKRMAHKLGKRFNGSMKATQAYLEATRMPLGDEEPHPERSHSARRNDR